MRNKSRPSQLLKFVHLDGQIKRPNQTLYTICSCIVQWAMNTLAYRWPDLKNFPKLDDKVGIPPLLDGLGDSDPVRMGWRLRDRTDGWCII
jgi:hypothetical protein